MQDKDYFDDKNLGDSVRGFKDFFRAGGGSGTALSNMPVAVKLGLFGVIVLFGVSVIWTALTTPEIGKNDPAFADVPLLKVESDPFRTRPEDPGGMDIPNENSTLYSALDDSEVLPENESETKDPETEKTASSKSQDKKPQKQEPDSQTDQESRTNFAGSKQFAGLEETLKTKLGTSEDESESANVNTDDQEKVPAEKTVDKQDAEQRLTEPEETKTEKIENLADLQKKPEPKTESESEASSESKQETEADPSPTPENKKIKKEIAQADNKTSPVPSSKPETRKKTTETSVARESASSAKAGKEEGDIITSPKAPETKAEGNFFVQLGSVKSKQDAKQEWDRLENKYPDVLKDRAYRVQKADLGDRGIFYRIQAGPYDQEKARSVCTDIKKSGKPGGCLVVKR